MMTAKDIAWIAALLEGEGSLHWNGRGHTPVIELAMTDLDVVERAWRLMAGPGKIITRAWRPLATKPIYRFHIYSDHAAAWMMTIYAEMGRRRRDQIRTCLAGWRKTLPHPSRRQVCKNGHVFDRLWGDHRACSVCHALSHLEYRTRNRAKLRERNRETARLARIKDPERVRENLRRWRAKRKLVSVLLEAV